MDGAELIQRRPAIDWARVRQEYEAKTLTIAEIATRHGISRELLFRRRAKEGWALRRPPILLTGAGDPRPPLSSILTGMIDRETAALRARLEGAEVSEEDRLRSIEGYARVVSKALDIRSKEHRLDHDRPSPAPRRIVDDARREELARCLEAMYRRRHPALSREAGAEEAGGER